MMTIDELKKIASQVRRDIIRMVRDVKSGHPGGSLGCADFFVALYFEILEESPEQFRIDGKGQDMFFLSNGHISPVWYSTLARRGYFALEELKTFRKLNSRLQGHPSPVDSLSGIRIASGSLGQGLSIGLGTAFAKKSNQDTKIVYVLLGDGELDEGQNWEAAMFASAKKVDNLIAVVDYNKKQIDGSTDDVCSLGNLRLKFEAFDWEVLEMNGNDIKETVEVLRKAKEKTHQGKPVIILMHTEMGMGVDFMMGTHKWHGSPPNEGQAVIALAQLPETLGDY